MDNKEMKYLEKLLYKIGNIVYYIGTCFYVLMCAFDIFSYNSYDIKGIGSIFYIFAESIGSFIGNNALIIEFFLIIADILILCPIFYSSAHKNTTRKDMYIFKNSIYMMLNLCYTIFYILTFIIFILVNHYPLTLVLSFYGIICGAILVRKNIENIMGIKEKTLNIVEILANLCIVTNIFIIVMLILSFTGTIDSFDFLGFYSNENINLVINIFFIIITGITIILTLIKSILKRNKEKNLEGKNEKVKIILKICLIMFLAIIFFQVLPCTLISFELLKELNKYIKTRTDEIIFNLLQVVIIFYPIIVIGIGWHLFINM